MARAARISVDLSELIAGSRAIVVILPVVDASQKLLQALNREFHGEEKEKIDEAARKESSELRGDLSGSDLAADSGRRSQADRDRHDARRRIEASLGAAAGALGAKST